MCISMCITFLLVYRLQLYTTVQWASVHSSNIQRQSTTYVVRLLFPAGNIPFLELLCLRAYVAGPSCLRVLALL